MDGSPSGAAPTIDTGVFRSGAGSVKCDSGAGNSTSYIQNVIPGAALGEGFYLRVYLRFAALPATIRIINIRDSPGTSCFSVKLTLGGKVQLFNQIANSQIGADSVETVGTGIWHRFELYWKGDTGAAEEAELRLNGVLVASISGLSLSDSVLNTFNIGWVQAPGASKVMYADDLVINDAVSSPSGWVGESAILTLKPVSDSARTGWTAGAGGTTNLWDAVNSSQSGLAVASATDTSQIKDLAANTTDTYEANMQSPDAAGIPAGNQVVCVQAYAEVGQDSATGTSFGLQMVSNPSAAEDVVAASTTAAGTHPTGWYPRWSAAVASPGMSNGTQPVLRIRKNTSSGVITQTADAILMVVEYAPYADIGWVRVIGPDFITTNVHTLYTVPAARRFVLRHIHAQNNSGSSRTFTFSIGEDAAATRLYDAYPLAPGASLDNRRKYVLAAGEAIRAYASTNDDVVLTITGELIET